MHYRCLLLPSTFAALYTEERPLAAEAQVLAGRKRHFVSKAVSEVSHGISVSCFCLLSLAELRFSCSPVAWLLSPSPPVAWSKDKAIPPL